MPLKRIPFYAIGRVRQRLGSRGAATGPCLRIRIRGIGGDLDITGGGSGGRRKIRGSRNHTQIVKALQWNQLILLEHRQIKLIDRIICAIRNYYGQLVAPYPRATSRNRQARLGIRRGPIT